jgi:hypothetical protein
MPNGRFLIWTALISLGVVLGVKHYEQRKAS